MIRTPKSRRGGLLLCLTAALALLVACSTQSTPEASPDGATGESGAEGPGAGTAVEAALFGTHVKGLASGTQPTPPQAGSIRLWDSGVAWRELEPRPGDYDWAAMDRAVDAAEATGAEEILWVHGSTPQWAAKDPQAPGLYGPGTSSPPRVGPYLETLREVANRYRGRITAYQVWNEANIGIFYTGTARSLANLTIEAHDVLADADPDALLVGASTTVRSAGPVKGWYGRYTAALADLGWPVDAMAVHLYPPAREGAEQRAGYARLMRSWLATRGWSGPVWDTEVNYGDRRDFATEVVTVPQDVAAGWVARTYIDSLALGVQRVFWYAWNDHILGVDQVDPATGAVLPAGQAYLTVQQWLGGARWDGCTGELVEPTGAAGALTTCRLTMDDGTPAQILFTHAGTTSTPVPEGTSQVCQLDGTCAQPDATSITVTTDPLLLRLTG